MFFRLLRGFVCAAEIANETAGRALSWLLPLMTAVTLAVIISGAVFRVGWVWLGETVVYMHAALFMLAAGYTLRRDAHVRVDLFYARFSPRAQAMVNLGGALFLLLPVCGAIFVYSLPYVAASWSVLEHSPEGEGLGGVFLLKTCIPLFAAMMILEGLAMAARAVLEIWGKR
ncbi:MAG: TRAP transporter small permease subunit [Gammaproteobacteria bacterium]